MATNGLTRQSVPAQRWSRQDMYSPLDEDMDRSQSRPTSSCRYLMIGTRAYRIFCTSWQPGRKSWTMLDISSQYRRTCNRSPPYRAPLAWNTSLDSRLRS